ncbi:ComF family protein [Heyndrickxia ginsengihumi]|uniref:ComF family protein n=1 Tax=Heyndrickxia ginsengihumi TaxID=363870 RepID=UPI000470F9BC|nr:ComF family protein [Heyndrickxia ginsengihumi]
MNEYCLYCHERLDVQLSWLTLMFPPKTSWLCHACKRKLTRIVGTTCRMCCRPLENIAADFIQHDLCLDCVKWEKDSNFADVLVQNISLFAYNDGMKEMLARFKFRGDYILAKIFSDDIKQALHTLQFDMLVPIPLSKERLAERGFNQAKALAVEAGFETSDCLERIHTEKQSKKTRAERFQLEHIFYVNDHCNINGKTILLVDDIYTTGSTVRHAAYILRKHGAKKVCAFTLARG